jgi:hypothetical protein
MDAGTSTHYLTHDRKWLNLQNAANGLRPPNWSSILKVSGFGRKQIVDFYQQEGKDMFMSKISLVIGLTAVAVLSAAAAFGDTVASLWPGTKVGEQTPKVGSMPATLAKNLANFDDLDFRVYSGQRWQELHKSHGKDIVVHYPDGHTTTGLDAHIEELKPMFTFAPDAKITEHPIRFGTADGQWTAVNGFVEGTFSKPMMLPSGESIPPTGKKFRLPMATIGHWNKQGVMSEEYLYWDNAGFMKQIGVTQ